MFFKVIKVLKAIDIAFDKFNGNTSCFKFALEYDN